MARILLAPCPHYIADPQWVADVLDEIRPREIIHGGAAGADWCAGAVAELRDIPQSVFKADWKAHGRAAGPIRNQQMLDQGKPDLVLAFPGGRGTADMVRRAKAAGVEVREIAARRNEDAHREAGTKGTHND
jgi:hypothetical protein